jgi:hypothetical protein
MNKFRDIGSSFEYLSSGHPMISGSPSLGHGGSSDGGDGLQTWKVAANVVNKQSRTADKGWSPSLRVGRASNTSWPFTTYHVTKHFTKPWTWSDPLERRKQCTLDMRFGTWSVRACIFQSH